MHSFVWYLIGVLNITRETHPPYFCILVMNQNLVHNDHYDPRHHFVHCTVSCRMALGFDLFTYSCNFLLILSLIIVLFLYQFFFSGYIHVIMTTTYNDNKEKTGPINLMQPSHR